MAGSGKKRRRKAQDAAAARRMQAVPYFARKAPREEIAEAFGVGVRTVDRWRAHPDVLAALDEVREAARDATRDAVVDIAQRAVRRLSALMDSEDERVALDATKTALDRFGHPVVSHAKTEQVKPPTSPAEARTRALKLVKKLADGHGEEKVERDAG